MRVPSGVGRSEIGINLTPMIDVVFQLIIFFLVSSRMAKQEAQMELPLPVADHGVASRPEEGRRLTLNILAGGGLVLAGRHIEVGELPTRLAEVMRAEQGRIELRIRGDRQVPYAHVEPVLRACAQVGVWDVKFSVYRRDEVR